MRSRLLLRADLGRARAFLRLIDRALADVPRRVRAVLDVDPAAML